MFFPRLDYESRTCKNMDTIVLFLPDVVLVTVSQSKDCFLQHPDLTVTSEERVLNAILLWCCKAEELFGWERVDEMMLNVTPELVFGERLNLLEEFLDFVRFPLLPHSILRKVCPRSLFCYL